MFVRRNNVDLYRIILQEGNFYCKPTDFLQVVYALKGAEVFKDFSVLQCYNYMSDLGAVDKTDFKIYKERTAHIKDLNIANVLSNIAEIKVLWVADQKNNVFQKLYKPILKGVGVYNEEYSNSNRTCYSQVVNINKPLIEKEQGSFHSDKASIVPHLRYSTTSLVSLVYFTEKIFGSFEEMSDDYLKCTGECKNFIWDDYEDYVSKDVVN